MPSFSFFLKMLENIFLKFPEEVWKRGLSKLDRRGEVCGEWELVVVKDERGRAEKREERELAEEWPWPELERGDCGSERGRGGGLRVADIPPNVTGEDSGRGIALWPDVGRNRTGESGDNCREISAADGCSDGTSLTVCGLPDGGSETSTSTTLLVDQLSEAGECCSKCE